MDTDLILKEVGNFGKYQVTIFSLIFLGGIFTSFYSISYVFTAGDINYRCQIDECDTNNNTMTNESEWLPFAVPFVNGKPAKCYKYQTIKHSSPELDVCKKEIFLKNQTERCNQFHYYTKERTIVNDFHLECDENNWKRAFVGTANNIGQFIGLPLGGLTSDRFGRKNMFTISVLLSTIMGVSRSYSTSYEMFVTFEVLDAVVTSACYSACFIIGIEILAPSQRVLGSVIISSFYTVGEVILGLVAWYLLDWRLYLRALYAPGVIFVFYIWLLPETLRWLVTNKKYTEAKEIVDKIASTNKIKLSHELSKQLENLVDNKKSSTNQRRPSLVEKHKGTFKDVITSKIMMLRTAVCSFSWMTNAFVFYGLALGSVSVAGNKYFNFILVSLAECPAYVVTYFILDRYGRRISLFLALVLSGLSCLAFFVIPTNMATIRLIFFLFGKCAITVSFSVIYVFSSELFPTNARHSLMGTCSMFGRFGSMMAPLSPLLAVYVDPSLIFGSMAIIAGVMGLYFPETLNQQLPDTIAEAEMIGVKKKIMDDA